MKASGPQHTARLLSGVCLEVEGELNGFGSRRDEVRPAERGEEVVQGGLVRQVDDRQAQAPLIAVAVEQVVIAHAGVKQVAWSNAGWIVVLVKCGARDVN